MLRKEGRVKDNLKKRRNRKNASYDVTNVVRIEDSGLDLLKC
jgi:hypothetical protein